jgi:two-component system NtrC family sensor kinase
VIRDNGQGIPKEVLKHIFEPFFTTKEKGKGTGLGLSLSYGIIQRLGGMIEVESEINKGTSFTITMPLQAPARGGTA